MSKHFRIPGILPTKLEELGIPVSAVLERAQLPPDLLNQPRILVTTEQLFALWRGINEISSDRAIGFKLGTCTNASHFDPVALAALSTASFGDAIRQIARHKQLSCPEEVVLEDDGATLAIQFRLLLANEPEPEAFTDFCFAWVLSIARLGTGTRMSPLHIEFDRPREYTKDIEAHFGCSVRYGASRNAIVFRASDTALPFVTRNVELLAMLAPQLDEELKRHSGQGTFPERVRAAIQRKLAGRRPKMQEVAQDMRISSRTLQRRLQDAGYTFQQILEEARHQLARYYLIHLLLEVNETAYLLGYEDLSSFVRAFRMWEGVPPAHWRDANRTKVVL
jgi:AraC-like DNA-binding protein